MKKALIALGLIIFSLVIIFSINSILLFSLLVDFEVKVDRYESVTIIEKHSEYGKLIGNGNGIQFFGVLLVQTTDVSELDKIKSELSGDFEAVEYCKQTTQKLQVKHYEHGPAINFSTDVSAEGEEYYCIYFFNSHHPLSNPLDIKGY